MMVHVSNIIFLLCAALTVFGALVVAFSPNIVRSAFALLMALSGMAALYAFLGADFLAVTQVLVYIGGIAILFLFVLLLTKGVGELKVNSPAMHKGLAFVMMLPLALVLYMVMTKTPWAVSVFEPSSLNSTINHLGHALLTEYLLPFELISILLLAALVGSLVIVRREVR